MDPRNWASWRCALCCVLVAVAGGALAQETPRGLQAREKVNVSLGLLVSQNAGATIRRVEWGPFALSVGDSLGSLGRPTLSFGAAGGPDGCSSGSATFPVDELFERYGHAIAWSVDAKLLSASTDRLELAASWKRFVRGAAGEPVEVAAESIPKLALHEGDRVLLDYAVPPASDKPACARNFELKLTADIAEDPALAGQQIEYEIWLGARSPGPWPHEPLGSPYRSPWREDELRLPERGRAGLVGPRRGQLTNSPRGEFVSYINR